MQSAQFTRRLRGRAIGALFFIFFGAIWLILGLYARGQLDAAALCWIAGCALALAAAAVRLMQRAGRTPATPEGAARNRVFYWINAGQWVAVFVALNILHRLRLDVYGVSVIAVVVGLHFFPLARLFRNPLHYATGALMVAWSALVALKAPLDILQGITALGAGVILWLSAVIALALCALALRRAPARLRSQAA
jgi:hypothetical protein